MPICRAHLLLLASVMVLAGCSDAATAAGAETRPGLERLFQPVADVPLGPAMNRMDYQSLDGTTGLLYLSGMGAGKLLVFDTAARVLDRELPGFPKVTGVLAVPEQHKLYLSVPGGGLGAAVDVALGWVGLSSGKGRLAILELGSLHEIARLPSGVFPDGIAYDPESARIFVSDEIGGAVTAIEARTDRPIGRIDIDGEAGNVRYDPRSARIYVPVQTRNDLAVIDPKSLRVIARLALPGGQHPHGLIISPEAAIGYVACDADDVLLTVDLATGAILDTAPLGRDPDVLAVDPGAKRLYVAAESGLLSTFDLSDPRKPRSLGEVFAGPHAHSVAVDPSSHDLYLPIADLDGRAVMRILQPRDDLGEKP